jgi:ribosomal protein S18 acetylase RimI-like enzyme
VYERPGPDGEPEIVGVMVAFGEPHHDPEHYEIETLAVLEKCQGEGVGQAFLALAEERIVERGIQWARLYTNEVMTDNYAWYKRSGYVDYERRVDRGFNRIFFEKQIAPVAVREMRAWEGEQLREIRLRALKNSPEAFASTYADSEARSAESWTSMITGGDVDSRRYVAIVDGQWAGMAGSYRSDAGVELISMWADPAFRGRGVGEALVKAVLRHAGDETVGLWVMQGNDTARRLYERCGFVADGDYVPLPDDPCRNELRMIYRR